MDGTHKTRRRFVAGTAGAALAALVPQPAPAQRAGELARINPADAGKLHREALERIRRTVGDIPISSRDGLHKLVGLLRELELINGAEAEALDQLVDALFSAKTTEELRKRVIELYDRLAGKGGELGRAILSIARDSVDYAKSLLKKLGESEAIAIVAADVAGAITGGTLGAKLGTSMAVIGAIGGGIYGSARAAYGPK